jgi:hypothetical protein
MQKSSDFRIGWTLCWKWRNCVGLADELQVGFLHRSKGDRVAYYCVFVPLDMGAVSRSNYHLPWPLDHGGPEALRLNAAIVRAEVEEEEYAGQPEARIRLDGPRRSACGLPLVYRLLPPPCAEKYNLERHVL